MKDDQTINRTWNVKCPTCKAQAARQKGALHTKSQWNKYHSAEGKAVEPLVKPHA